MATLSNNDLTITIRATDKASQVFAGVGGSLDKLDSNVSGFTSRAGAAFGAFAKRSAVALAAAGVAAGGFAVKSAGDFEQTRIGLENMLGSAERAKSLLADINRFAAETPFEFPELADATRQLVAFGFSGEDAFKTMQQLGDVSAAVGAPIGDLSYLMGTLRTQGRAFTIDIRQFAQRGIPIYEYLAKVMGVTEKEMSKLIEEGKVGFPEVQKAFEAMTGQGGKFYNTMERQSKSFNGQLSTLKDNLLNVGRNLVGIDKEGTVRSDSLFGKLTEGVGFLNEKLGGLGKWMENYTAVAKPANNVTADWVTSMTFLELATRRAERAEKDLAAAKAATEQAVAQEAAAKGRLAGQNWNVEAAQKAVSDALAQYGEKSPEYIKASEDLQWAQYFLNQELNNTAGATLNVITKFGEQEDALLELESATKNYQMLVEGLSNNSLPGLRVELGKVELQAMTTAENFQRSLGTVQSGVMTLNGVSGTLQNNVQTADKFMQQLGQIQGMKVPNLKLNQQQGLQLKVGNNAEGTSYWRGGLSWVGERGPELVDLPRGSKVIPNRESMDIARGASGQTVNIGAVHVHNEADEERLIRSIGFKLALAS